MSFIYRNLNLLHFMRYLGEWGCRHCSAVCSFCFTHANALSYCTRLQCCVLFSVVTVVLRQFCDHFYWFFCHVLPAEWTKRYGCGFMWNWAAIIRYIRVADRKTTYKMWRNRDRAYPSFAYLQGTKIGNIFNSIHIFEHIIMCPYVQIWFQFKRTIIYS